MKVPMDRGMCKHLVLRPKAADEDRRLRLTPNVVSGLIRECTYYNDDRPCMSDGICPADEEDK